MSVCTAIGQRRVVTFDYEGHHRVVELAAHGPHASTRNPVVRGYQIAGSGVRREVPFWHTYLMSKVENLQILEQVFLDNPPDYRSGDVHISPIHCEL